jgi:hypothetical protein
VWFVYAGPYNIAVDPCNSPPFGLISATVREEYKPKGDDPIFPGLGDVTWTGNFPQNQNQNCVIKGHGQKNAPTLECGNNQAVDFKHDARFNEDAKTCKDPNMTYSYRRGWTAEY